MLKIFKGGMPHDHTKTHPGGVAGGTVPDPFGPVRRRSAAGLPAVPGGGGKPPGPMGTPGGPGGNLQTFGELHSTAHKGYGGGRGEPETLTDLRKAVA